MKKTLHYVSTLMFLPLCLSAGAEFHVATDGSDANPGTADKPFATFDKARDAIRVAQPKDGATVWIAGGVYRRSKTFTLQTQDSGVAYRARNGEQVRVLGGIEIKPNQIKPVAQDVHKLLRPEVRDKIVEIDMSRMKHVGPWKDVFKDGPTGLVELYINGKRMPLAQYPNKGFMTMKRVIRNGDAKKKEPGIFLYNDARHKAWRDAVKRGLWFKGFWRVPWQSEYVRVTRIDTKKKSVHQAGGVCGGIGSKYKRPHGSGKEPYIAVNLPEEIDMPGEWCIDFKAKKLYFLPPCDLDKAEILIGDSDAPILKLEGASHIAIQGITFEANLGNGIEVNNGQGVRIAGCTFHNIGMAAVVLNGGTKHTVLSCDMHEIGAEGIQIRGGDRKTLKRCDHAAINNHIHHFARIKRIYAPAIYVDAVGATIRNNLIHDTPHVGILYKGNDNLFELNEVYNIALVSNDMGGFYTWGDWTSRGNVIRSNFVHSSPHAEGVYCDDGDSGDIITGNVFYELHTGVFIGGGHDNIATGNISVNCERGFHLDARGVSRNYTIKNRRMVNAVKSVNHKQPPWSIRYPEMVNILEHHPELPTGTSFIDNIAIGCKRAVTWKKKDKNLRFCKFSRNISSGQKYPNLSRLRAALESGKLVSPAKAVGRIPIRKIGLFVDEYRRDLPKHR